MILLPAVVNTDGDVCVFHSARPHPISVAHLYHVKLSDTVLVQGEWKRDSVFLYQHGQILGSTSTEYLSHAPL